MPEKCFLVIRHLFILWQHHKVRLTPAAAIYGRAGRIPVHNQQYKRAQPLQQQKQHTQTAARTSLKVRLQSYLEKQLHQATSSRNVTNS